MDGAGYSPESCYTDTYLSITKYEEHPTRTFEHTLIRDTSLTLRSPHDTWIHLLMASVCLSVLYHLSIG